MKQTFHIQVGNCQKLLHTFLNCLCYYSKQSFVTSAQQFFPCYSSSVTEHAPFGYGMAVWPMGPGSPGGGNPQIPSMLHSHLHSRREGIGLQFKSVSIIGHDAIGFPFFSCIVKSFPFLQTVPYTFGLAYWMLREAPAMYYFI